MSQRCVFGNQLEKKELTYLFIPRPPLPDLTQVREVRVEATSLLQRCSGWYLIKSSVTIPHLHILFTPVTCHIMEDKHALSAVWLRKDRSAGIACCSVSTKSKCSITVGVNLKRI